MDIKTTPLLGSPMTAVSALTPANNFTAIGNIFLNEADLESAVCTNDNPWGIVMPTRARTSGDYFAAVYRCLERAHADVENPNEAILCGFLKLRPDHLDHFVQFARDNFSAAEAATIETSLRAASIKFVATDSFVAPAVVDTNRVDLLMRKIQDADLSQLDLVRRVTVCVFVAEFYHEEMLVAKERLEATGHYQVNLPPSGDSGVPLSISLSSSREEELLPAKREDILRSIPRLEQLEEGGEITFPINIASPRLQKSLVSELEQRGLKAEYLNVGGYSGNHAIKISKPRISQPEAFPGFGEFGDSQFLEYVVESAVQVREGLALAAQRGFPAHYVDPNFNTEGSSIVRVWRDEESRIADGKRRAQACLDILISRGLNSVVSGKKIKFPLVGVDDARVRDLVVQQIRLLGFEYIFSEFNAGEKNPSKAFGYVLVSRS